MDRPYEILTRARKAILDLNAEAGLLPADMRLVGDCHNRFLRDAPTSLENVDLKEFVGACVKDGSFDFKKRFDEMRRDLVLEMGIKTPSFR